MWKQPLFSPGLKDTAKPERMHKNTTSFSNCCNYHYWATILSSSEQLHFAVFAFLFFLSALHLFDPSHLDALVTRIRDHLSPHQHCVPFVFADGCAPLQTHCVLPIIESLNQQYPSDMASSAMQEYWTHVGVTLPPALQAALSSSSASASSSPSSTNSDDKCSDTSTTSSSPSQSLSSSSSLRWRFVDRLPPARAAEAAKVATALSELQLRLSERALLGQVLVTLQTLAVGTSSVFSCF